MWMKIRSITVLKSIPSVCPNYFKKDFLRTEDLQLYRLTHISLRGAVTFLWV